MGHKSKLCHHTSNHFIGISDIIIYLKNKFASSYLLFSALLSQLQSYAVGENRRGTFKGNLASACGENSFVFVSEGLSIVAGLGFILLAWFVHLAMPVVFLRNRYLRVLASNANDYSFEYY